VLQLWPVYVPCLIEETLIITLTVMKYIYSKHDVKDDKSSCIENLGDEGVRTEHVTKVDETERIDASNSKAMTKDSFDNDEQV
jgi:hypothetical protein